MANDIMNTDIVLECGKSIRSQLTEHFRGKIRRGELQTGDLLPAARQLARALDIAEANVHHALTTLAREGLIDRRPGVGSVVLEQRGAVHCVAFYIPLRKIQETGEFARLLVDYTILELEKRGIGCRVIYETRGGSGRALLKELAAGRHIQGVIVRNLHSSDLGFYRSLAIPFSGLGLMRIANRVCFFNAALAEMALEALARKGCRSCGVFFYHMDMPETFTDMLAAKAAARGMEMHPEWILTPGPNEQCDYAAFAWQGFRRLRRLKQRPEGLVILSDNLIPGLVNSFYRHRVAIPEEYHLAVHHTRENPVIFPFACTLLQHSIAETAAILVDQVIDQFHGRKPHAPVMRPTLKEHRRPD